MNSHQTVKLKRNRYPTRPAGTSSAEIRRLAHFDPLTGRPNHVLLHERVAAVLLTAERRGTQAALRYLDLDRFKVVNDSLGHPIEDILLEQVAKRLKALLRAVDTVSRIGGDEFIIGMPDADARGAAHVGDMVNKLCHRYRPRDRRLRYRLFVAPLPKAFPGAYAQDRPVLHPGHYR